MAQEAQLDTFIWNGQARYRCPSCDFDSYSELMVLTHWRSTHAEVAASPSGPTLFDADNKPIMKEEQELYVPPELQGIGTRASRSDDDTPELRPDPVRRRRSFRTKSGDDN